MKTLRTSMFLLLAGIATAASAQETAVPAQATTAQSRSSTVIQAEGAPVTVNWGQPTVVPNVSDYRVGVADLDTNGDNTINRSEVPATHALSSEFKLVDRNRDGRITEAELAAWR